MKKNNPHFNNLNFKKIGAIMGSISLTLAFTIALGYAGQAVMAARPTGTVSVNNNIPTLINVGTDSQIKNATLGLKNMVVGVTNLLKIDSAGNMGLAVGTDTFSGLNIYGALRAENLSDPFVPCLEPGTNGEVRLCQHNSVTNSTSSPAYRAALLLYPPIKDHPICANAVGDIISCLDSDGKVGALRISYKEFDSSTKKWGYPVSLTSYTYNKATGTKGTSGYVDESSFMTSNYNIDLTGHELLAIEAWGGGGAGFGWDTIQDGQVSGSVAPKNYNFLFSEGGPSSVYLDNGSSSTTPIITAGGGKSSKANPLIFDIDGNITSPTVYTKSTNEKITFSSLGGLGGSGNVSNGSSGKPSSNTYDQYGISCVNGTAGAGATAYMGGVGGGAAVARDPDYVYKQIGKFGETPGGGGGGNIGECRAANNAIAGGGAGGYSRVTFSKNNQPSIMKFKVETGAGASWFCVNGETQDECDQKYGRGGDGRVVFIFK